jgi:predicted enzyme related to lactoylglutathione lyase
LRTTGVDATLAKGKKLGAHEIVPGTDIPNTGRFAIVGDATGAVIGLFSGS